MRMCTGPFAPCIGTFAPPATWFLGLELVHGATRWTVNCRSWIDRGAGLEELHDVLKEKLQDISEAWHIAVTAAHSTHEAEKIWKPCIDITETCKRQVGWILGRRNSE